MSDNTSPNGLHDFNPQSAVIEATTAAGGICALARDLDINKGHVSRAVNHGYVSPKLRRALDIPIYANVPICADCGIAHTYACKRQYTRKRVTPKPRRKRYVRAWRTYDAARLELLEQCGLTVQEMVDGYLDSL